MYKEFEQAWCNDLHNGLVDIMIVCYFLIPITLIMAICAVKIVMRSKVDVPRYSPEPEQSDEPKNKKEKSKCCGCSCCLRKEKVSKEEGIDAEGQPLTKSIN